MVMETTMGWEGVDEWNEYGPVGLWCGYVVTNENELMVEEDSEDSGASGLDL